MKTQETHTNTSTTTGRRLAIAALVPLFGVVGLAACSDDVKDVLSFVEYAGATADVLDDNDIELDFDLDCEGSTDTNEVTCTSRTDDGRDVVSTGENLGDDDATLIVEVDGVVLYDGLLDDTP